ncbi:tripartite motif-containing protein 2-like [Anneissia japonica]|uniref:tripartite motif-containing protein 2-like n=1 Tax=Anneissia japonica TaxID=1529436 RepID=UPI0014255D61|nr:tripartite motif-containing protein 2-like [Anneissia japonica]
MATSELSQFLEEFDENVLQCTICFTRLQNPKTLKCLHSFCLACLEDWVKVKGKLTCPTCLESYTVPKGGLQKLPPNTFLNNALETIGQTVKKDQTKCVCGKRQGKYYCQECRHYLCSTCSDHHKTLHVSANHKLHTVEDVRSMAPQDFALLHSPLCLLHNKPLEFYCTDCNTPICVNCTLLDHKVYEGHKPISISEAFKTFKGTSVELLKVAHRCKNNLEDGLKAVIQNATKLGQNKNKSLRDIDNHVQKMVKKMFKNGDKMKKKVKKIYENKKKVNDAQIDELKTTISDINSRLSFLNHLLKSNETTAMQSSETVITALKDRIDELPKTEPNDNGQIYFHKNQTSSLQQCDIGTVTEFRVVSFQELKTDHETRGQQTKHDKFKTQAKIEKTRWPHPIKGLINTIRINKNVRDVVKYDDCLFVSCRTNKILKYKQSGEYVGEVMLPPNTHVNRMHKLKNGNIAFSDCFDKCIKVCTINGHIIKSIDQGVLTFPEVIQVEEASKVVYVADYSNDSVFLFDTDNGQLIWEIHSLGIKKCHLGISDFHVTKRGHLLVLEYNNSQLELFDHEGRSMKVLVNTGEKNGKVKNPCGFVVDKDDNIIIASENKLQLFSSDGNFIKRMDKYADGINNPKGLSIISYYPQRVVVANGDKTLKIFNY